MISTAGAKLFTVCKHPCRTCNVLLGVFQDDGVVLQGQAAAAAAGITKQQKSSSAQLCSLYLLLQPAAQHVPSWATLMHGACRAADFVICLHASCLPARLWVGAGFRNLRQPHWSCMHA
jgi:hypothetical protein